MSNLSEEEINKIVENMINGKPINMFAGINKKDFEIIKEKLIEKGWQPK